MKRMMFAFAGMLLAITALSKQEVLTGKVITVIDGNTVEVRTEDNETYKIMLHGIDCPELGQGFGEDARKSLERLLQDKSVSVEVVGKNRYGVRQAIIISDEMDVRHELLKEGLAWTSESNPLPELEGIREKAEKKGKGLWKENDPTPPWEFRRQQSRLQYKSS